jgi:bifunctional ADP-heptose synthase (sugar kinase/adenylyltransferase)
MDTQQLKKYKILLIGDDCLDIYQYGTVDRISPEAPVPVFVPGDETRCPGMAGNVYRNLEALGCDVNYLHGKTSTKTRLLDSRSKQQLMRIDQDVISTPICFDTEVPRVYDAIVISDYNKGTVDYHLIEELIATGIPVFVDTKKTDLKRFEGAYIKINELEYNKLVSKCSGIIVTMGERGARYNNVTVGAPLVEVSDVCGAGDTFLAALTYQYLDSKDIISAIEFAVTASTITVQHLGCYAPKLEEIK